MSQGQFIKERAWPALVSKYSWLADMVGVEQSPLHHAEGDVAVHTEKVLDELTKQPQYLALTELEQEILWLSALFHDVEKRTTTQVIDGQIVSPGHAKLGEYTTRQILFKEFNVPFHIRETICAMVRHHGLPIWLMERENPQKELLKTSLRLNTQHLALLAKADILGRICQDKPQLLDKLELFQLYCLEQSCWGEAKTFLSASNRFGYFNGELSLGYQPYEQFRSQVVLMSGLPGVGKDYYIEKHYHGMPVISLDAIRRQHKISPTDSNGTGWVVQQAKEQARQYLRQGTSFVWNATNLTRKIRNQIIELCVAYQAEVTIVYLEAPYLLWQKQNREREYAVPAQAMGRMLARLEPPTLDEAHHIIYNV